MVSVPGIARRDKFIAKHDRSTIPDVELALVKMADAQDSRDSVTGAVVCQQRIRTMQSRDPKKSHRSVLSRILLFVRNFLKYPAMQGSLIPSSHFLVNGMLRQVDWEKARLLVEFGPGVGTMTREILRRMHEDAMLVTIELNAEFVHFLQDEISDPRLRVVHASAAEVLRILRDLNFSRADYIISSLPYTAMGNDIRKEIMQESLRVLSAEGSLLFFQYTKAILPTLRASFSSVRQEFELLNFPPALIFNCTP